MRKRISRSKRHKDPPITPHRDWHIKKKKKKKHAIQKPHPQRSTFRLADFLRSTISASAVWPRNQCYTSFRHYLSEAPTRYFALHRNQLPSSDPEFVHVAHSSRDTPANQQPIHRIGRGKLGGVRRASGGPPGKLVGLACSLRRRHHHRILYCEKRACGFLCFCVSYTNGAISKHGLGAGPARSRRLRPTRNATSGAVARPLSSRKPPCDVWSASAKHTIAII
jgi:hypothetical protein